MEMVTIDESPWASQYAYIKRNPDKYRDHARKYYYKVKDDPERFAQRQAKRREWYEQNRENQLRKQREQKRERKLKSIEYLGGHCQMCKGEFHPAVFEFHHRNPEDKDRDPSKMMTLSWDRLVAELNKCELLCANCHRITHHGSNDI